MSEAQRNEDSPNVGRRYRLGHLALPTELKTCTSAETTPGRATV